MKISRDVWLLIAMLLPLALMVAALSQVPQPGEETPRTDYTTYDHRASGAKAFYLVLRRLGYHVSRNQRPLDELVPGSHSEALVIIEPDGRFPILPEEIRAARRWVEQGNLLIVFGAGPRELLAHFGFSATSVGAVDRTIPAHPGGYFTGARWIRCNSDCRLEVHKGTIVVSDSLGAVAAERKWGRGRAVIIADPGIASNRSIGRADNSIFLVNLVSRDVPQGGRIIFDEYHHGYREAKERTLPRYALASLLQLAAAAILGCWSFGKRFGAAHPLPQESGPRSSWEYVESMAGLYRRAGARQVALDALYRDFRRELLTRFGLPSDSGAEQIAEAAGDRSARLCELLVRCEHSEELSDGDLVRAAQDIERLRRELGFARTYPD